MSRKSLPGQLKRRNRLCTSYGGKLIEKDFEAVASLKVVEQVFDGNAGPYKYLRAAQDLRIAVHDEILINHCGEQPDSGDLGALRKRFARETQRKR